MLKSLVFLAVNPGPLSSLFWADRRTVCSDHGWTWLAAGGLQCGWGSSLRILIHQRCHDARGDPKNTQCQSVPLRAGFPPPTCTAAWPCSISHVYRHVRTWQEKGFRPGFRPCVWCEADRQGQAPTHVKLQPCSPLVHHHVALTTCQTCTAYGGGPHRRQHWLHNSAYGRDVGGHVQQAQVRTGKLEAPSQQKPALGQTRWACSRLSSLDRVGPRIQACFDTSGSVSKARMAWISQPRGQ